MDKSYPQSTYMNSGPQGQIGSVVEGLVSACKASPKASGDSSRRMGGSAASRRFAIAQGDQTNAAHHQNAAVRLMPDQPPRPLLEGHGGLGQCIGFERFSPCLSMCCVRASTSGSPGGGKGSLSMTTNCNASPGTSKPSQKVAEATNRQPGRPCSSPFAKALHQPPLGPLSLDQHLQRAPQAANAP